MARFVEPGRLLPLIAYFACAVATLLLARWGIDAAGWGRRATTWLVVAWFLLVPSGAAWMWVRRRPR